MNEMIGELFSPVDMPEPPKESFFKGLFGGGTRNLDREELCKCIHLSKKRKTEILNLKRANDKINENSIEQSVKSAVNRIDP